MIYSFAGHCLDLERRELLRDNKVVPVEPQVFDLLHYLIQHRDRVVTKEQLYAAIWTEKIVSESTLSSRIAAVRRAIGDSGDGQRLIRTFSRKGFRFVGEVREQAHADPREQSSPPARLASAAERRQLTILNCRIADPLPSGGTLDPEDLSADVAALWAAVAPIIEHSGGHVAHRTAESLLAYFGFPAIHEDDAERAVRAALSIVDTTRTVQLKSARQPLRVAVGIATGLVVIEESDADNVTSPRITGETSFSAARIVALCEAGRVMISGATRALLGGLFEYRPLEGGGNGAIHGGIFEVVGDGTTANRFEALRAGATARVGRDDELGLLLRRWQQSSDGEGRVVLLSGEAGIGKSHLLAALREAISADDHGCLSYYCAPHGTQSALQPVITQLEELAGIRRGDTGADRFGKLERLVDAAFGEPADGAVLLADLLSIPTPDREAPLALSPQRRKEKLFGLLATQVERLAAHQRVLVIVEDAHWIDPTTAEFLDLLVERVRTLPVLLVITHRPSYEAPWLGQSHVTALLLNRLGPRESGALVRQVAAGRELAPALVQQIVAQSDGVPLFVEEVTKAVIESGSAHGSATVGSGGRGLPMPATVRASLAARLERLAGARTLMQTCSALGREFSFGLAKAVTALPASELEPMLQRLVASGLVHQRGVVPEAVYSFKHALLQDAAYETMVRSQREQVHRRIVDVFEREFADLQLQQPEVFAHHCTEAGEWGKAIAAHIRAARTARDRSAGVEAEAQVEAAMKLLPRIEDNGVRRQLEGRLQVALADSLVMTQGFASPAVMTALSKARALLDAASDPVESISALCGMFNYHLIRSESPACLALVRAYLGKRLDQPTATLIHYMAGTAHLHLGDFAESVRYLESALSTYDEEACRSIAFIPGYHLRSFVLIWLGLGYLYLGFLERAQRTIAAAVKDARNRSHPFTLVSALLAQARHCQHTLDFAGAIEATEEGAAIAIEQRSPYHVSRASILRALNVCDSGRPGEGIALLEQALVAHRATGANFQSSYNLSRLAKAHAQAGHFDRAAELAERAIADVEQSGERWWQAEAMRIKGEVLMASSPASRAEAENCFERALACARTQGAKLWELQAAGNLAEVWSESGRSQQAAELLAPVYASFSEGLDTPVLSAAKRTLLIVSADIRAGETEKLVLDKRPIGR